MALSSPRGRFLAIHRHLFYSTLTNLKGVACDVLRGLREYRSGDLQLHFRLPFFPRNTARDEVSQ
jgi:hypothetical protein